MASMIETRSILEGVPESAHFEVFQTEGSVGSLMARYSDAAESIAVRYDVLPAYSMTEIESKEAICIKVKLHLSDLPGIGRLLKPIPIELTIEPGNISLTCEELAIYANGKTTPQVLEEFATLFNEQYEYFTSLPTDRLSPRAAAIKRNFLAAFPFKK
jgi:hypothetical protein